MMRAKNAGSHSAPSEMDPHIRVVTTISARNTTKGRNETHSPP